MNNLALDTAPGRAPAAPGGAAPAGTITVSGVTKVFETRSGTNVTALADTDFRIEAGQFVSIVGPSGCGKSTIMRIIAGLMPATDGRVLLGDTPVTGPSSSVGIAFQKPVLLPWYSVERNISLPADLEGGWSRSATRERVQELLRMVRLDHAAPMYPRELSGGMQQRVSIARALMSRPAVLLMDEPFGALDALTREHLHDELLSIWTETSPTVVFITHDISEAVYLSDRVLVMAARPGRVIADVSIDLPRPRGAEVRATSAFTELASHIRSLILH